MSEIHNALLALGKLALAALAALADLANGGSAWDQAAVVLPTVLAVVAAVMTTFSLESRTSKIAWRVGLIVFGLLTSAVTLEQQKLAHQTAEEAIAEYYEPDIAMVFSNHQFQVWNYGKSDVMLWGTKLDGSPRTLDKPRIIAPTNYYSLLADSIEKTALKNLGNNGEAREPFELYLSNKKNKRFIATFELWFVTKDEALAIHTQLLSVEERNWE